LLRNNEPFAIAQVHRCAANGEEEMHRSFTTGASQQISVRVHCYAMTVSGERQDVLERSD